MGFSRQEHWSGLLFPSPEDLPNPGIEPRSPALQADSLLSELPGKAKRKEGSIISVKQAFPNVWGYADPGWDGPGAMSPVTSQLFREGRHVGPITAVGILHAGPWLLIPSRKQRAVG